jgi:hypothetical protein
MSRQLRLAAIALAFGMLFAVNARAEPADDAAIRDVQVRQAAAFAWVFRDSTLTITDVQTRLIDPSTAITHVRWTLDGAKVPPGAPAPPREGIQLQVLRKTAGQWLIVSFQNTNSVPEQPFPKGPPPTMPAKGGER